MQKTIKELMEIISQNKFVLDLRWQERTEQNFELATEIRDRISNGELDDNKAERDEILDRLEGWKL